MPKPEHARVSAEVDGVIRIYNVADMLPRARAPETRTLDEIKILGLHHSGFLGRAGYAGVEASARFSTTPEPDGRGFRTFPYHFWFPYEREHDHDNYAVVYQGLQWTEVGTHIGLINVPSLGLALQGNLTSRPVSPFQKFCFPRVLRWARCEFNTEHEVMHCDADEHGGHAKSTCPGMAAREFIDGMRHS